MRANSEVISGDQAITSGSPTIQKNHDFKILGGMDQLDSEKDA